MTMTSEIRETDIVVIGAGIAGAGVAAMLAGKRRVVLLEREDQPGYHTTGRSAALFLQNYGNGPIRALTRASGPYLRKPPADVCEHPVLSPRGALFVAGPGAQDAYDALLAEADGLQPQTVDQAVKRCPILRRDHLIAAAFEPDAQDIDVAALHQGWLGKARRGGVEVVTNAEVRALTATNGGWRVETGAGALTASVVVNAAGAWADVIAGLAGLKPVGLQPMRRSMAVLPPPAGHDIADWPLVADVEEHWYAKPEAGRLWVSPADEDPVEPHDAYVDDMVLAEGLARFQDATTVEVTRVERSWAGLRTFAPDRTPVVGFDPAAAGFFWLAGQGGYGIQTSPAMSALAAALVLGDAPPPAIDAAVVAALSPARFR
jgi:D-arginine dehydrogenase